MSSYKIAVIGDKDSVIGFKALGLEAVTAANTEEARTAFLKAARNRDEIAIIYITEQFAAELKAEIEEVKGQVTPAVILIPSKQGTLGLGMAALSSAVEKAIGTSLV